jgi:mono/diheme cytochrome c family protein
MFDSNRRRVLRRTGAARCYRALLATLVAIGAATAAIAAPEGRDVTPARGPSLVARIESGVDWGAWGRAGSDGSAVSSSTATGGEWLLRGFDLDGGDLYRINCRSCHGPEAKGARSGIPPLLGALSPAKSTTGVPGDLDPEIEVRHRLLVGGRVMPAFVHLENDEVGALMGYLRALRSGRLVASPKVHQPAARVGEHVVKATCQICHDAVPSAADRQPLDQQVTALSQIPENYSVREFVRKVRAGSTGAGQPTGRMPRFEYLSDAELEAAYVYLAAYPPRGD